MRILLLSIILLCLSRTFGQGHDTVINAGPYRSYYSRTYKQPIFVVYTLHKGGGGCDRSGERFRTGGLRGSATAADYARSGYDQGHMAPYEDFAYDCGLAGLTFRFFNAVPQAPGLNRGQWSRWESVIRQVSQRDTLVVVAGGMGYTRKIGNGLFVPDYCWKVVYSRRTRVVLYALLFKNEDGSVPTRETITTLEKKLKYEVRHLLK
jgi:DNA/RNA endonuclease G (NUC1)